MEGDSLKHYPELHCQGLWLGLWWRRSSAAVAIYQSTFSIRIYKMSACLYLVCLRSVFWLPLWLELLWGSSSVTPAQTGEGWGLGAFRFLSSKKLFLSWGPAGCGGEQVFWTGGDPRTLNKSIKFQFQLCMLHLWGNVCILKEIPETVTSRFLLCAGGGRGCWQQTKWSCLLLYNHWKPRQPVLHWPNKWNY